MGKTFNKHKQLDDSWCSGPEPNYVKRLSSLSHTCDRPSHKLRIVKGQAPVAEGRRNVPLVTLVTKVIASDKIAPGEFVVAALLAMTLVLFKICSSAKNQI